RSRCWITSRSGWAFPSWRARQRACGSSGPRGPGRQSRREAWRQTPGKPPRGLRPEAKAAGPSAQGVQRLAGDDQLLDFRGAFVDPQGADLAVQLLHLLSALHAAAAEELYRSVY